MSNTEYTPGPWRVAIGRGSLDNISVRSERVKVALVTMPDDACLIAAAPDMYEALQEVASYLIGINERVPWSVAEAIAKVEGKG